MQETKRLPFIYGEFCDTSDTKICVNILAAFIYMLLTIPLILKCRFQIADDKRVVMKENRVYFFPREKTHETVRIFSIGNKWSTFSFNRTNEWLSLLVSCFLKAPSLCLWNKKYYFLYSK